MKKVIIIVAAVIVVGLLAAIAIPAFAQDPPAGLPEQGQKAWQAMYEACSSGDWDAMAKAAQEFHEELGYPVPGGLDNTTPGATSQATPGTWRGMMGSRSTGGWGGMMGGRGGGWGGMMGW